MLVEFNGYMPGFVDVMVEIVEAVNDRLPDIELTVERIPAGMPNSLLERVLIESEEEPPGGIDSFWGDGGFFGKTFRACTRGEHGRARRFDGRTNSQIIDQKLNEYLQEISAEAEAV